MRIRKLATSFRGVLAKLADRLPWRREFALALLFIGTPLVTSDIEVFALNLTGLVIAALAVQRVMQAKCRAGLAATRQSTRVNDNRGHESGGVRGQGDGCPVLAQATAHGLVLTHMTPQACGLRRFRPRILGRRLLQPAHFPASSPSAVNAGLKRESGAASAC